MDTRERMQEHAPLMQDPAASEAGGDRLAEIRREANTLLAAGRTAISRALSNNSEKFLTANRQAGGE